MANQRCFGAQDEIGPVCDGPDIRRVLVVGPESDFEPFETYWCADCRDLAIHQQGYDVAILQESYFNLQSEDAFIRHSIDRNAVSTGWKMAYLIYW